MLPDRDTFPWRVHAEGLEVEVDRLRKALREIQQDLELGCATLAAVKEDPIWRIAQGALDEENGNG